MVTFPAFGWQLRSFAFGVMLLGAASAPATAQDGIPCPGEPTNMAIVYGDVVSCTLISGDTDLFTFSGAAGEVIVVIGATACISLAAPSGATAQACATNLASARLDAALSETGTYTLTASPSGFGTTYTLALERVTPASPRARQLNYESMLVDDINIVGDVDMFSFTGGVGDAVSILVSTTDTRWPCIELIAPAGNRSGACVAATSNQIDLLLQQSGTYAILVKQREGQSFQGSWPYSLQLQCVSGACLAAPNPPSGLTGMVSTVATTLIWNAPTTGRPPSSYVVEAGMVSGGTDVLVFDTMSRSTTFMAPGIPNGTYFVRLRSRNSVGTSGPSNEITITGGSGCALPAAPATFIATSAGLLASLQWAPVGGNVTSYVLEAGSSSGGSNIAALNVGLITQLTVPAPRGTYFVRVRARNSCGLGPASNEVTLVVGCSVPPGAPSNLTVTISGRLVTLSWPAALGQPEAYILEVGTASGASNLVNVDLGNQLSLSANAPPGTYFVRVRASNACGTSVPTVERMVVVP